MFGPLPPEPSDVPAPKQRPVSVPASADLLNVEACADEVASYVRRCGPLARSAIVMSIPGYSADVIRSAIAMAVGDARIASDDEGNTYFSIEAKEGGA